MVRPKLMISWLRRTPSHLRIVLALGLCICSAAVTTAAASPLQDLVEDVVAISAERTEVRSDLEAARADAKKLDAELAELELEYADRLEAVQEHLVSLYTAGHSSATFAAVMEGIEDGSAADLADLTAIIRQLGEHEGDELDAVLAMQQKIERTADDLEAARTLISKLKQQLADIEDELTHANDALAAAREAARAEAEAARERAEALAAAEAVPLMPVAVTPESVARGAAETAEEKVDPDTSRETDVAEPVAADGAPSGYVEVGEASWYGDSFAGQTTANGEIFDPGAMTAAHPHLPFGTMVTVAGPGGSVVVRINDRGPFVGGRVIDLSEAAAAAIGLNTPSQVTITVNS